MLNIYGQLPMLQLHSLASGIFGFGADVAASIRENFRINFARALAVQKALGVNHAAIAKRAKIEPPVISQLKKGKFYPGPELLQDLAEALGTTPDALIKDPSKPDASIHDMAKHILESAGFRVVKPS